MNRFAQLAFTESVRSVQEQNGSGRAARAVGAAADGVPEPLTLEQAMFIEERDGFYLASVGETGWPYVQYKGGPPGFVHVLDASTIAFADVRGNRQYITTGNVQADDRVALFFMDYPRQARLKLFGHARTVEPADDPALAERLGEVRTDGRVERLMVISLEGGNWNCAQHITPRFSEPELEEALAPIRARLAALEQENAVLRARVAS